jgi:integrase
MRLTESVDPIVENPNPRQSPVRDRKRDRRTIAVRARAPQGHANALVVRTVYPEIALPAETVSARSSVVVDFLAVGDRGARDLPIPISGRITYRHRGLTNLCLRVSSNGDRSWSYTWWSADEGRPARYTIGGLGEYSVEEALTEAIRIKSDLKRGIDPRVAKRERREKARAARSKSNRVAALVEPFLNDRARNVGKEHLDSMRRNFTNDILPAIGTRRIDTVAAKDVRRITSAVMARGAEHMANRVHGCLSSFFRWASDPEREYITSSPVKGLSMPAKETPRQRWLDDHELVQIWNASNKLGYPYEGLIKLCIMTGCRRGEAQRARWRDFNFTRMTWRLPETKQGTEHTIFLSPLTLALMKRLHAERTNDRPDALVFTVTGDVLTEWSHIIDELRETTGIDDWRGHDLRRSFATGAANRVYAVGPDGSRSRISPDTIDRILGHQVGGKVRRSYIVPVNVDDQIAAMNAWGAHLESIGCRA